MFEEDSFAGAGVLCVIDLDFMAMVAIPCVANVETTGCVWRLHFVI